MPRLYKNRYRINSTRLPQWDYRSPGMYFITVCTRARKCWFGDIVDNEMMVSKEGAIVKEELINTQNIRKNVLIDTSIIMPNHIHAIINIFDTVETSRRDVSTLKLKPNSISSIINQIKSICTKRIRLFNKQFSWQPRFYEHIIRNDYSLGLIRHYIKYNALNWETDDENPVYTVRADSIS